MACAISEAKTEESRQATNKSGRTHLRKNTLGCIHGAPERGQGEEGTLEDEMDERVERLFHVGLHEYRQSRDEPPE